MATRTNVRPPKKGDIVNLPPGWDRQTGDNAELAEACDEARGFWVCSTHREAFQNNMQASSHEGERGTHVPYWYCDAHGPEVPA